MRFNYTLLSLLIVSGVACSDTWPYGNDYLKETMTKSYSVLENKTGLCMDMRKRPFTQVKSDFLYSLPQKKREVVLFFAYQESMARCVKAERLSYLDDLVRYTAISKNRETLDSWLELHGIGNDIHEKNNELIELVKDIPYRKIIELSERPEFYNPFNRWEAAKLVEPE